MNMMTFLEEKCGPLTEKQKIMVQAKRDRIVGYARPLGRGYGVWFPAVLLGNTTNVFDQVGHYQLAAPESVHYGSWDEGDDE